MKPYWTICDESGAVLVENIFNRLTAETCIKNLAAKYGRPFILKEYGLRSEAVYLPESAAK